MGGVEARFAKNAMEKEDYNENNERIIKRR